ARVTLPACSMRAVSEPSERSGARRSGFPSGCSIRAVSGPTVRSGVRHRGTTAGYQPIYGNISSNPVNFKARSESTTLRQEKRVTDSLTLHSIDKSIKHRVGGYT